MAQGAPVFKTIAGQAITAGTPFAAWTPAAGKKFRLLGFHLGLSVAGVVILKDGATEFARTGQLAAGTSTPSPDLGEGRVSSTADNVLNVDVSATGTVHGFLWGYEE